MVRKSIFERIGLPKEFGVILLTFGLILCVSPYMSGMQFGIFSVPQFEQKAREKLKVFGPPVFGVIILLFFPIWKDGNDETASKSIPSIPWDEQVLSRHLSQIKKTNEIILSLRIELTKRENKINHIDDRKKEEYIKLTREYDDLKKRISDLEEFHFALVKWYYEQLNRKALQPTQYIR